jgi:2-polyprenyl-3-methyl-5-hydroxy-6-metoxy-1,4-benzoquinol methylase
VVGVDPTEAPLRIAERTRQSRRLTNVSFRTADADELPFADGEFDVAVCRFAFHHFEHPQQLIAYINLPRTPDYPQVDSARRAGVRDSSRARRARK